MRITTKSFDLAVYQRGRESAEKLAFVLPGRLDSKDYAHMISHVDFLADMGYLALSFDPPGTWETSDNLNDYTMTNYKKAIDELIEHFGNRPTFVMGHSRGSTMATLVANTNEHVEGFVSIFCSASPGSFRNANYADIKSKGHLDEYRDHPPGDGNNTIHYKLPYSFFKDSQAYDLADDLATSSKPKLFMYGTNDVLAPLEKVQQLFDVSAEPKELYELKSGHDYRYDPALIDEVNFVVGKFIERHKLL